MKRNRWKNRLSLLLVALMLFTTLAPVALAVGEPEALTEVTEPAESDKVSEDQNEPPAPAEETPNVEPDSKEETPMEEPDSEETAPVVDSDRAEEESPEFSEEPEPEAVLQGANPGTEITFVKKDGSETTVSFTDENKELGLNGTPGQTGIWIFKSYFIGWSENPNYIDEGTGHLFYETYTLKDVKNAGLFESGEPVKLYALYASASIQGTMTKLTGVRINDEIKAEDFVTPGKPLRDEDNKDRTVATYQESDGDYKIQTLDAVYKMNPFVAAAVYKDPWIGALDNGSDWSTLSKPKGKSTVIDLHVELDPRIVLPEEFDLTFTSYVFRPYKFFSALDANGNPIGDDQVYPYLGIDQPGDDPGYGILNRMVDNVPSTTFRVKSYLLDNNGEKVPVHKFILRTRTRVGYDANGKRIPATMDQIQSDMHLTFSSVDNPFTVSNADAKAIAEKQEDPIAIRGFIDGRVKGNAFDAITSEDELLDFVKGETPTPPVNPPVVEHKTISVEKIWEDGNDEAKKRPDSITVKLLANGEDTGKRLVLSATDNWKGSFYGLDYTQDGKTIEYTVAEIGVKDYESKVSGSDKSGYIITNTVVPEKPAPAPTPEIKLPKIPHVMKPLVVPTIPKAGVGR